MALLRTVLALALLAQSLAISPGFNYGGTKVRGVNLGGWLVLEVRLCYPLHLYRLVS